MIMSREEEEIMPGCYSMLLLTACCVFAPKADSFVNSL